MLETRKSFVRYISHELRTPLNTVYSGIKLAIQQFQTESEKSNREVHFDNSSSKVSSCKIYNCDNEQKEVLQEISMACGVAVEILNEFLMFDKLEQDSLSLNKQNVGVIDFLTTSIKMIFVQIREKKINLVLINYYSKDQNHSVSTSSSEIFQQGGCSDNTSCDERFYINPSDVINIDKHKLSQVMRNLLSNAIKFTPTGGEIIITIKFDPAQSMHMEDGEQLAGDLVISVKDTGAGMSEADQKRLFKEVVQFRPHELQAGGGSGLGLMITKGIVDLHGGVIEVYSAGEGLGSTFTVRIPMIRVVSVASDQFDTSKSDGTSSSIISPLEKLESESSNKKQIHSVTNNRDDCSFSVKVIRRQSQNVLHEKFSQYESLLAKENNIHPLQLTPAKIAELTSLTNLNSINRSYSDGDYPLSEPCDNICGRKDISDATARIWGSKALSSKFDMKNSRQNQSCPAIQKDFVVSDTDPLISTLNSPIKTLNLLLVDDSGMSRKMMCRMLRSEGYIVDEADDGAKAVEVLKLDPSYDAILMDSHMPNMNGPEAASVMRSLGYKGVILGITGDTADKDLDNFINHGASKVLIKPVDIDDIKNAFISDFHLL